MDTSKAYLRIPVMLLILCCMTYYVHALPQVKKEPIQSVKLGRIEAINEHIFKYTDYMDPAYPTYYPARVELTQPGYQANGFDKDLAILVGCYIECSQCCCEEYMYTPQCMYNCYDPCCTPYDWQNNCTLPGPNPNPNPPGPVPISVQNDTGTNIVLNIEVNPVITNQVNSSNDNANSASAWSSGGDDDDDDEWWDDVWDLNFLIDLSPSNVSCVSRCVESTWASYNDCDSRCLYMSSILCYNYLYDSCRDILEQCPYTSEDGNGCTRDDLFTTFTNCLMPCT